jgi:succinate-acetate transporter protein
LGLKVNLAKVSICGGLCRLLTNGHRFKETAHSTALNRLGYFVVIFVVLELIRFKCVGQVSKLVCLAFGNVVESVFLLFGILSKRRLVLAERFKKRLFMELLFFLLAVTFRLISFYNFLESAFETDLF